MLVGILTILGMVPLALLIRGAIWLAMNHSTGKWNRAMANVVKIDEKDDNILLAYDVCGDRPTRTCRKTTIADCKIGDRVELIYHPKKPKRSLLVDNLIPKEHGMAALCVGGLGILLLVGCYLIFG